MNTKLKFNGQFLSHQGDTQWFSIEEIPTNAKKIDKTFIAKSEKSGHAHALCGDYEMYEIEGLDGFLIKVGTDGCTLNHTRYENLTPQYWNKNEILPVADHKPSTFSQGIYYVGIQKRKKHFSKVWERVQD
jgi:hypothetical protein